MGTPTVINQNTGYFKGLSINEPVQHIYGGNHTGSITRIQIPLIYVKWQGQEKEGVHDRAELIGGEDRRAAAEARRRAAKKDDKKKQAARPHRNVDEDDLPEFVPDAPPGR